MISRRTIKVVICLVVVFATLHSRAESQGSGLGRTECPIPWVPEDAELVYVGMSKARGAASISFEGVRGAVGLADLEIAPGEVPIYVMAASLTPVALRFSGELTRLVRVVNVGRKPMGFVGVPAGRASWFELSNCGIPGWDPEAPNKLSSRGWAADDQLRYLEALAGRAIDQKFIERAVGFVTLPSGRSAERDHIPGQINLEGKKDARWKDFLKHYPNGIIVIPAEDVVSSVPVRAVEIPN